MDGSQIAWSSASIFASKDLKSLGNYLLLLLFNYIVMANVAQLTINICIDTNRIHIREKKSVELCY